MEVRNTLFYKTINTILYENMLVLQKTLEDLIDQNNYNRIIKGIGCTYGQSPYVGQIIEWRIAAILKKQISDKDGYPYGIGCWWSIETINKREIIEYNYGRFYNSFIEADYTKNKDVIKFDEINSDIVLEQVGNKTVKNWGIVEKTFVDGLRTFVMEYSKLIDF